MKWIGQHIWDFISRFRNDVYLESLSETTQDHVVSIDANGKLYKQDVVAGDITGVTITTDSGGGSAASDTGGSADFSILGTSGVGVTNSGTTITATSVPGEIDHDSLLNFAANEHFTQANITTVGTISSGTWQGTALATAYIADDAVTFAKASGVVPKVYGSVIKILPSDFMSNDDGGSTKFGIGFVEVDGTSFGMKIPNANTELIAFVSIPEGMKATHVDIYDDSDT